MVESEQGDEVITDPLHHFNTALKRWDDIQRPRLSFEDYAKGRGDIHIHYVLGGGDQYAGKFCVVVKAREGNRKFDVRHILGAADSEGLHSTALKELDRGQQQLVLIHDVEVMQECEGTFVRAPGRVERLQFLDKCKCIVGEPLFQVRFFEAVEPGPVFEQGEGCPLRAGLVFDECPKQVVQRAPGVVNAIANHQRPIDNRRLLLDANAKDILPRFTLRFLFQGIGFTAECCEKITGRLQSAKVFLCPANLGNESMRESRGRHDC